MVLTSEIARKRSKKKKRKKMEEKGGFLASVAMDLRVKNLMTRYNELNTLCML